MNIITEDCSFRALTVRNPLQTHLSGRNYVREADHRFNTESSCQNRNRATEGAETYFLNLSGKAKMKHAYQSKGEAVLQTGYLTCKSNPVLKIKLQRYGVTERTSL